jgi:hypothetical protein
MAIELPPTKLNSPHLTKMFDFPEEGEAVRMTFRTSNLTNKSALLWAVLFTFSCACLFAQDTAPAAPQAPASTYQPKFHGDPAHSDSEAAALAYMRVVMRAQVGFNKQYGHYATSLSQLVHSGTFTQRMVNVDRGDYTVGFKSKKDNFVLTMTPKTLDAQHRSFFAENDGKIHADDSKPADSSSPVVETHHW